MNLETQTHKTDRNPHITNHKPWPFESVEVNLYFLRWLTAAKTANVIGFWTSEFGCLWKAQWGPTVILHPHAKMMIKAGKWWVSETFFFYCTRFKRNNILTTEELISRAPQMYFQASWRTFRRQVSILSML